MLEHVIVTHDIGDIGVRALTGFDEYLINRGFRTLIVQGVGKLNGYEVDNIQDLPTLIANMAWDFANILLHVEVDKKHPLGKYNFRRDFSQDAIQHTWNVYLDMVQDDDFSNRLADAIKEVSLEHDDPLASNGATDGENEPSKPLPTPTA